VPDLEKAAAIGDVKCAREEMKYILNRTGQQRCFTPNLKLLQIVLGKKT